MLEGLDDTDLEAYLDYNPWIVPLFEIDVMGTAAGYAPTSMLQEEEYEHNPESIIELSRAREAFEKRNGNLTLNYRFCKGLWFNKITNLKEIKPIGMNLLTTDKDL